MIRHLPKILQQTIYEWHKDKASLYAASITVYALLSMVPMLIIIIAVAGFFFGEAAVQGQLVNSIQNAVGPQVAGAIQSVIENALLASSSTVFTVVSIVIFLYASSIFLVQLKHALDIVWEVKEDKKKGIKHILASRAMSILFVLSFGFFIILSWVLSALIAISGVILITSMPYEVQVLYAFNLVISFLIVTTVFAIIYKYVPSTKIAWKDVWIGSAVTTLLFMLGNYLIGIYMRNVSFESVYGAIGSSFVMLFWVYYCAQVFFFGAEFTNVYAKEYGSLSRYAKKWYEKFF